ncbi:MAG TPA: VOC family protein [Candidatus Polarisedimenticolaceae bacterium]|nr:VOC family protein [Candidatus Polarisedimenticolaceae bacterium]
MFDHVTLRVKDLGKAKRFYSEALAPLGYRTLYESKESVGLGDGKEPTLWIAQDSPVTAAIHLAFTSPDHKKVDAFHAAGLGSGGRDNGKPGPRPDYGPDYYAAFVHDPDGNNIEAVCNKPVR